MSELNTLVQPKLGSGGAPEPGGHLSTPGSVAQVIGTGEHAQTAILYSVMKWTFCLGAACSAAVVGNCVWKGTGTMVADLKDVWTIFIPVITLALGYAFGKSRS